ncbi:MAG: DUF4174 domain-containing protein [Rhizobium sp.]|nr:DUF4174 domain-containing protein [Rhizobium sp.]
MKSLFVAFHAAFSSSQVFAMDSLSDLGWKNRVVLVFGNADNPKVAKQVKLLEKEQGGLEERDMVVVSVSKERATAVYGNVPALDPDSVRKDAGIEDGGFQVVLVGKDGGIKLRSENVIGDVEMFDFIDQMPMRRAEQK